MPGSLLIELPDDIPRFKLPDAVAARLRSLLDRRDAGRPLSPSC